uniref:Reverse transcriptase (RNA-dependent DNA polymerase) n=1 Tax=Schistocephalus solidus TaxID=70667 RepID=A0A0V0J9V6_SCHSO
MAFDQKDKGMPVNALKGLLLRCILNVQLLFESSLYRQLDGVAIGSHLGPILANIFMGKLEALQLRRQINSLKYYGRYVDDICAIISEQMNRSALMDTINQAHPSIQLTLEQEQSESLPFLDVLLSRSDWSIRRSIYRNKMWPG